MVTIKRQVRSAEEIKQWMDDQFHKDGKFKEYSFSLPVKFPRADNNHSNWNFPPFSGLSRSGNDPTIEPAADSEYRKIWAIASLKFDLE